MTSKAGYTSHGHAIPGAALYPPERPPVARCGGTALCAQCSREAAQHGRHVFKPKADTGKQEEGSQV